MTKKLMLGLLSLSLSLSLFLSVVAYASTWNYANSSRSGDTFVGYVQCKPSFNDNGQHAANGYIRYSGGKSGDTGRLYTATGKNANDANIYTRSHAYADSPDPSQPVTKFNYGFTWVAHGSPVWPVD